MIAQTNNRLHDPAQAGAAAGGESARMPASSYGRPLGLLEGLRAALAEWVPFGYQDETGFHLGVQPPQPAISYPAVW